MFDGTIIGANVCGGKLVVVVAGSVLALDGVVCLVSWFLSKKLREPTSLSATVSSGASIPISGSSCARQPVMVIAIKSVLIMFTSDGLF